MLYTYIETIKKDIYTKIRYGKKVILGTKWFLPSGKGAPAGASAMGLILLGHP